ncbi:SCL-interrupting locus protein [Bufo gargarizans]|uniref:SCL-interrupting locus protein n=1 Tax=Bufo gargarizans TaxID=30331 RepID=UPI001CF27594|nr:SCL-interrupting locus protein [Bufo gargarizans]
MSANMSVKNSQYHKDASNNQNNIRNMATRMLPINFPPSKAVLWDSTPMGDPIGLHFSYYRNPHILLSEKALRLSYRHAKTERKSFYCFLLGSFSVDDDEEGITLTIDRFDPGREKAGSNGKVPSTLLPGDSAIPCTIYPKETIGDDVLHTPEDFTSSFKGLQSHLHSREALDLSKLLTVRAHITYLENMDNLHFDLRWAAVTVANTFESTPIKPVPIIPTALARNLSSHNNIAQLQGTHKCGYLTMDQTRKLLLVLESDPKAYTLPLVGIWLSGITHIHSPQVWASCLRYMYSSSIKERVLSESGSFLIVLYSLTHKEPEFYECLPCIGHDPLGFQLLACEDALHLFKNVESSKQSQLQFELSTDGQNSEAYLFNEVSKIVSASVVKPNISPSKLSVSDHDSGVEDEDFSPRPSPRPHPSLQQATTIHPCVPELSLVFGSVVEPRPEAQHNSKKLAPLSSTPKTVSQVLSASCQNGDQPGKESSTKPLLMAFKNSKSQATKPCKVRTTASNEPSLLQNARGQARRNSTSSSSSSSLSTPRTGSSPDTSVHQVRGSANLDLSCNISGSCHKQPVMTPAHISRQSPLLQSPTHNVNFPLPQRKLSEMPKPTPNYAPCHPTNVCNCCHNIAPAKCHTASSWPVMNGCINHCGAESPSDAYPNISCPAVCCNAVCVNNCQRSTSRAGSCSSPVENVMSPGRRDSLPINVCSPRSCQHSTTPAMSATNGMLGLSSEAYHLLAEQDRQLKLLQTQIQRLLEAQNNCKEVGSSQNVSSAPKVAESVATETKESEHAAKSSVSIAVGTGASLFWNTPPCPEEEETMDKQDESDLCNELSAAVNNEQDASLTTIASSLQAVDIYSFAESSQLTDCGEHSPAAPVPVCSTRNESRSPHPEYDGRLSGNASLGTSGNPGAGDLPPEKFYKDLLSQVNHLLRSSTSEDSSGNESRTCEKSSDYVPPRASHNDQDGVLKATLKQLKSLGVNIEQETSDMKLNKSDTSDNACVLSSINPEALIPRLNYMSFTNIGLSGFIPNGVDLSMEANAIALKYLSESQLTQLSLTHASKNKALDSFSLHNLFPGSGEKSMVGLSVISLNNMSFATKKYLKRYNLIESNDSSDDEADSSENHCASDSHVERNQRMSPHQSLSKELLDFISEPKVNLRIADKTPQELGHNEEVNTLRNITNEISAKVVHGVQASDETSLRFFKDLNPKAKLTSGKGQFTAHPEKENGRNSPLFHARESAKKSTGPGGSTGDILDVNRLRQLPKLF